MTIVRSRDGALEVLTGLHVINGAQIDMGNVERFVAQGTWTQGDLDKYGLKVAAPFVAPEGKQSVGKPRYVEKDGVVSEVFDVEDRPPPAAEPTRAERFDALAASTGLSPDDLIAEIGARLSAAGDALRNG